MRCQPSNTRGRLAGFALAVGALAACSTSPKSPATAQLTTPSTTRPAPTTTVPSPEPKLIYAHPFTPAQQEVAKGYFAAERAFIRASASPSSVDSLFTKTHTTPMLEAARGDIGLLASQHHAVRLPESTKYVIRIDEIKIRQASAEIQLCSVDDGVLYDRFSGRPIDTSTVARRSQATMRKIGNDWKLAERTSKVQSQGPAACE